MSIRSKFVWAAMDSILRAIRAADSQMSPGVQQSQPVGQHQVPHLGQAALQQVQGAARSQVAVDEKHRRLPSPCSQAPGGAIRLPRRVWRIQDTARLNP
jgi:hypothetical protein